MANSFKNFVNAAREVILKQQHDQAEKKRTQAESLKTFVTPIINEVMGDLPELFGNDAYVDEPRLLLPSSNNFPGVAFSISRTTDTEKGNSNACLYAVRKSSFYGLDISIFPPGSSSLGFYTKIDDVFTINNSGELLPVRDANDKILKSLAFAYARRGLDR
jgi:hypothetical protein